MKSWIKPYGTKIKIQNLELSVFFKPPCHGIPNIAFTSLFMQLGATCSMHFTEDITHVVAGSLHTEKVASARRKSKPVVSTDWLYASGKTSCHCSLGKSLPILFLPRPRVRKQPENSCACCLRCLNLKIHSTYELTNGRRGGSIHVEANEGGGFSGDTRDKASRCGQLQGREGCP